VEFIRALPSGVGSWLSRSPKNGLISAEQPEHLLVWPLIEAPQKSQQFAMPKAM